MTKFTNAIYPEYHWVISFMVYAFHWVNVSSIRCIYKKQKSIKLGFETTLN